MNNALVICGPTASGKSQLGHALAQIYNGEVVNIDSMQIYQEIPIITASPSQEYQALIPYHLYNFISITQEFSVIKYLNIACNKIREISARGKLPIIIGGTGLYINSLLFGYNEIPDISLEVRNDARERYAEIGGQEFFKHLLMLDPIAASKLNAGDTQRMIRAYEVFKQTGKSIFDFQLHEKYSPLSEFNFKIIFLCPERKFLYQTCDERLKTIFQKGAIEEIDAVKDRLSEVISAIKAVGVQEIIAYLNGKITIKDALTLTQNKTRQYAKRQVTWFKNQIEKKITLQYSSIEEFNCLVKDIFLDEINLTY